MLPKCHVRWLRFTFKRMLITGLGQLTWINKSLFKNIKCQRRILSATLLTLRFRNLGELIFFCNLRELKQFSKSVYIYFGMIFSPQQNISYHLVKSNICTYISKVDNYFFVTKKNIFGYSKLILPYTRNCII